MIAPSPLNSAIAAPIFSDSKGAPGWVERIMTVAQSAAPAALSAPAHLLRGFAKVVDEPPGEDPDNRNRSRAHSIERGLEAVLRRGQETAPEAVTKYAIPKVR